MGLNTRKLDSFNSRAMEHQFKWSLGKTLVPTVLLTALTLLSVNELLGLAPFTDIPTFPLLISTTGFAIMALVAWAQTKAGIGKNALVAALDRNSLWVRLRSPLNSHIGTPSDNFLVELPLQQFQWSRVTQVKTLERFNNKPRTTFKEYLDLGPESFDTESLKKLLSEERAIRKKASQSTVHYPITLREDGSVRLSLYNVSGGAGRLQKLLPSNIEAKESTIEIRDLT